MSNGITRRDFLDGVALSMVAGALAPYSSLASAVESKLGADYYPPVLTGMRGSHEGSYEVAHKLAWKGERPSQYERIEDEYDLVVVGGGISGLAAAYLYRKKKGPTAKILVLDNHDDFGGHAKRNEFHFQDKMLLSMGGSVNLEQANIGPAARSLLEEIGVDFQALRDAGADDYVLSNGAAPYGLYLNANLYGKDQLVAGPWSEAFSGGADYAQMINGLNLPADDKVKLIALIAGEEDLLDGMSLQEKVQYVHNSSYASFLREKVKVSDVTIKLTEPWASAIWGVGLESVSVMEAFALGSPGLYALGLPDSMTQPEEEIDPDDYRTPMFPDGNASVARLLVRKLIPAVASGETMQDVVTARFDYSQLDRESSPVRIRLNSTAVNVVNRDEGVDIKYVSGGKAYEVRGHHCILAGYNGMVPHLCPELPTTQKENLAYGVKTPFVWVNVLLKDGAAVHKGGASLFQCPGSFFELVALAPRVSLGAYQPSTGADEPEVFFMGHMPAPKDVAGQSGRDLFRLGRHRMLRTSFAEYEQEITQQLTGMYGQYGFDAERDIEAITINRWSHGYAYEYMQLDDPEWEKGQAPHELGRQPMGRISIANSDSEAKAYVQAAIDAAVRAVGEVTG